ncbi:MAG TPA: peptidylprolyl isomerase [Polyangiaceae bacterium]|nr:peptidylprolyl isomerase [Polyangiaceae bacterium]
MTRSRFDMANVTSPLSALMLSALCLCSGCVLTTFEGPGEAPRVAPPPNAIATHSTADDAAAAKPLNVNLDASVPNEISARHLLVSYRGALRAPPGVGRTKEEARARAEEAEKRAKAGEDFVALVKQFSDEPGAADRGGDLGKFDRQSMVPAFANAAFALKVGEVSSVVETQFGFHVILRTE